MLNKHVSVGLVAAALLGMSAIPAVAQGVNPASGLSLHNAVHSSGQGGSDSNSAPPKHKGKSNGLLIGLGLAALAGGIAVAASNGSPASP